MQHELKNLKILALSIFVVLIMFMFEGNKGFNLWDEGYLWYGVQRVMLGEVPIRDFSSYDPGRYYWSAALMHLWGNNGIMALRITELIPQVMALFVGLFLISQTESKKKLLYLLLSSIILVAWMTMSYKIIDYLMSILLIGTLAFLIQKPTNKRFFLTGACIGLVAFFGRNHGIYGVAGSIGVMIWLSIKRPQDLKILNGFVLWSTGIVTGFIPLLLMVLLIPGFAMEFWNSILYLFEVKATNLALPVPWPWLADFASSPFNIAFYQVLVGLFFIALVAFGVLSIPWVIWQKFQNKTMPPVLVAASFLALPYAHYAYSRPDVPHLGFGIFPLLIGCLVMLSIQSAKIKWPLSLMLCAASLIAVKMDHPGWQCLTQIQCMSVKVSGNDLVVDSGSARDIWLVRELAKQYAPNGQNVVIAPFFPGAYALLERKSPMRDIYALLPRSHAFEQDEIERIKASQPAFVFIFDVPLDGRDDLRFRNTRPLINQYIIENYNRMPISWDDAYQIYIPKSGIVE